MSRSFEAAHAIRLPDGSMEPTHGHTWRVRATVGAGRLNDLDLVMDFHELERVLGGLVGRVEGRALNEAPPFKDGRVVPTAERVAWWFASQLGGCLPAGVVVVAVEVEEAPGCVAVYRPVGADR